MNVTLLLVLEWVCLSYIIQDRILRSVHVVYTAQYMYAYIETSGHQQQGAGISIGLSLSGDGLQKCNLDVGEVSLAKDILDTLGSVNGDMEREGCFPNSERIIGQKGVVPST